jgi:aspartate carbamoyltransferase catalytic subunit
MTTIRQIKGRLTDLTIGLCGDLKFGRTVHSLISSLVRYPGIRFILISPEELRVPDYIREDVLKKNHVPYEEVIRLEDAMPKLDVLYMTRVQRERFFNEEDYVRMKDFYILDAEKMKLAREDCTVLHPLPRVNEISVDVDNDPRACYFRQVQYGVYIRMALIMTLLEVNV